MNRNTLSALIIILLGVAVLVASVVFSGKPNVAQEIPVDTQFAPAEQIFAESAVSDTLCSQNDRYVVVAPQSDSGLTTEITVFNRSELIEPVRCALYSGVEYLFKLELPSDTFVFGLVGEYLVLDKGTGPSNRMLEVYNLPTKTKVYEARYADLELQEPDVLSYWRVSDEVASRINCPDYETIVAQSFTPQMQTKTVYSLSTQTTITSETRCVAVQ